MKITIFGGTGGLGSKILQECVVDRLGSKDVNLMDTEDIEKYFKNNQPDIVIFFNAMNTNNILHKYTPDIIDSLVLCNISGVVHATSLALQHMRIKNYGRLIYASSVTVDKNIAGTSIYAATKAFFENFVKTIAIENASKGITANCIQLGYMDGGLTYTLPKDFIDQKIQEIPAKRLGKIEEISNTIEFLIDTEYVNGSTIKLTGGL